MITVKRTLPALEFTKSPLIIVLAQVRITPVLSLETYIPRLQDILRTREFPRLITRKMKTTTQDSTGRTQISEATDWVFADKAGQFALVVGDRSIALVTSAYVSFENFAARIQECLQIVHEVVNISGVERLGLRYVDLIEPSAEKPLSYFLESCVLGLSLEGLGLRMSSHSQTIFETSENRKLVVRATERPRGLVIPPDLLSLQLKLRKSHTLEQTFGILDLDHYAEFPEPDDYSTSGVIENLCELHDVVDQAFRKATTENAKLDWK